MAPLQLHISTRWLSFEDRLAIHVGLLTAASYAEIARSIGRATSTVTREVSVNRRHHNKPRAVPLALAARCRQGRPGPAPTTVNYCPLTAQRRHDEGLARPKASKLASNPRLHAEVVDRLNAKHSPEQISRRLRADHPDDPEMWVSHEVIYQSLYVQGRGALRRELTACLRSGRAIRKPRRDPAQRACRIRDAVLISDRPAEVEDRAVPGHWESDLITGQHNASAIGTVVERSTRFVVLLHLPHAHGAVEVRDAMIAAMSQVPALLRRSITCDRGGEMARHGEIGAALDLQVYFCDPHSPWQRGTNENTNGLLRQYFPKGTDLSGYHPDYLSFVADELNNRPRKTLGWKTPAEAFQELLSNPPVATTP